jgi:putative transcriptional regulator
VIGRNKFTAFNLSEKMAMNLNIDFFKITDNKVAAKGRVLIAEPFLNDTYFKRSVVFITEHNHEGSVGFVLNKPVELKVQDVIQNFPFIEAGISIGGPVNTNTLHYIHTLGDLLPESIHVLDNIYWGGDFDTLKKSISEGKISKDQIRFFLGYSGWGLEQLENELKENAWLVSDINSEMIMKGEQEGFWNQILENMDNKYQVWANFPENPGLN